MPHGVQSQERIVDALSGFGFSESQASVYAVLLRLGRCSVRDLASATGFSRITIQGILDKFEGDHIVCGVYEGKKKRMYSPANIRGLKSLLDGQIDKLEQQRDAIASLFAEATEADRKAPRGFGVHALRGVRGMEFLRDDILQCNADISIFGDVSALSAHDYANLSRVYFPAVLQAHIPMRFLLLDTVHAAALPASTDAVGGKSEYEENEIRRPPQYTPYRGLRCLRRSCCPLQSKDALGGSHTGRVHQRRISLALLENVEDETETRSYSCGREETEAVKDIGAGGRSECNSLTYINPFCFTNCTRRGKMRP